MNFSWIGALIGAVAAALIALLVAPLIPAPGSTIVAVVAWIAAAALLVVALLRLLRGNGVGL